jgi:hypothetical protein
MFHKFCLSLSALAIFGAVQAQGGVSHSDKSDKSDNSKGKSDESNGHHDDNHSFLSALLGDDNGDKKDNVFGNHGLKFFLDQCDDSDRLRCLTCKELELVKDIKKDIHDLKADVKDLRSDLKSCEPDWCDIREDKCDIHTDVCDVKDDICKFNDIREHDDCHPCAVPLPAGVMQGAVGFGTIGLFALVGSKRRRLGLGVI